MPCPDPITDGSDCGHLCLCVCACSKRGVKQPRCPNWHVYNIAMTLTGATVTDPDAPDEGLDEILLSMVAVTEDHFVWTRPRIADPADVGNVTIKARKTLDQDQVGECVTNESAEGNTGTLRVEYLSVTTDVDTLVYEWNGSALCKTAGTGRIASIDTNWIISHPTGTRCCMIPKVVRRIWDKDFQASYTLTVEAQGAFDNGEIVTGGICLQSDPVVSKCQCMNSWTRSTDPSRNVFGTLVDGYYLSAVFETVRMDDPSFMPAVAAGCGIVDQVGACGALCISSDCDPTANLSPDRVRITFGPWDFCLKNQAAPFFGPGSSSCGCCTPATETPNRLQVPVNYGHKLHCCESGFDNTDCTGTVSGTYYPEKCPEGEGTQDPVCPFAYAALKCVCPDIPETQSSCEVGFEFPTCPIEAEEWTTVDRENESACYCTSVGIRASE